MNRETKELKEAVELFEQRWKAEHERSAIGFLKQQGEELKRFFIRKNLFTLAFEWTPENVGKIIELNDDLYVFLRKVYDEMLKLKSDFDARIAFGDETYENYTITTRFWYEAPDCSRPDENLMWFQLKNYTDWEPEFRCGPEEVTPFEKAMFDEIAWTKPPFDVPELEGVHIHYFLYALLNNNDTYCLHDLLRMKAEDFRYEINVSFRGM